MVFSLDGSVLYVAQIFKQLDPIVADDRVWALPVADYATSTFRGGGKIWKVDVGVRGAPLHR